MKSAVEEFYALIQQGRVRNESGQTLIFQTLDPPDPKHPECIFDTFFSCVAHHVEGHASARICVRDRLLCHLGSIVFNKRYARGYDIVDTGCNNTSGFQILKRHFASKKHRDTIVGHYAVREIICRGGAYMGCRKDMNGAGRVGSDIKKWVADPAAFAYAIGKFVDSNLGRIPSAPRRGMKEHEITQTTSYVVFLYLLMDMYPGWRPIVWEYNYESNSVRMKEYAPEFNRVADDPVEMYNQWYNNSLPIYIFYDPCKKRFKLLQPSMNPPLVGAICALRKCNIKLSTNTLVGHLVPERNMYTIHALSLNTFEIDSTCFYMIYPANVRHAAFQIPKEDRIYVFTVRRSSDVYEDWEKKRVNQIWQNGGPTNNADMDHTKTVHINDSQSHHHVIIYASHEARTGVWPTFTLTKKTCEIIVIVSHTLKDAEIMLVAERPEQPLVYLDSHGIHYASR